MPVYTWRMGGGPGLEAVERMKGEKKEVEGRDVERKLGSVYPKFEVGSL